VRDSFLHYWKLVNADTGAELTANPCGMPNHPWNCDKLVTSDANFLRYEGVLASAFTSGGGPITEEYVPCGGQRWAMYSGYQSFPHNMEPCAGRCSPGLGQGYGNIELRLQLPDGTYKLQYLGDESWGTFSWGVPGTAQFIDQIAGCTSLETNEECYSKPDQVDPTPWTERNPRIIVGVGCSSGYGGWDVTFVVDNGQLISVSEGEHRCDELNGQLRVDESSTG